VYSHVYESSTIDDELDTEEKLTSFCADEISATAETELKVTACIVPLLNPIHKSFAQNPDFQKLSAQRLMTHRSFDHQYHLF